MKTKTIVGRISEYGNDSLSLVIFPPHFEVTTRFEDDRFATEDFDRQAKQLVFIVDFVNPDLHNNEDEALLRLKFNLPNCIPVELFEKFVYELNEITIGRTMQDLITRDIINYLTSRSSDYESFLDLDEWYEEWYGIVKHLVLKTIEEIQQEHK